MMFEAWDFPLLARTDLRYRGTVLKIASRCYLTSWGCQKSVDLFARGLPGACTNGMS